MVRREGGLERDRLTRQSGPGARSVLPRASRRGGCPRCRPGRTWGRGSRCFAARGEVSERPEGVDGPRDGTGRTRWPCRAGCCSRGGSAPASSRTNALSSGRARQRELGHWSSSSSSRSGGSQGRGGCAGMRRAAAAGGLLSTTRILGTPWFPRSLVGATGGGGRQLDLGSLSFNHRRLDWRLGPSWLRSLHPASLRVIGWTGCSRATTSCRALRFPPVCRITAQTSTASRRQAPIESTTPRHQPLPSFSVWTLARPQLPTMSFVTRRALSTLIPPKVSS
jgi:hypothetical protein